MGNIFYNSQVLCRRFGRDPESSQSLLPLMPNVFHLRKIVSPALLKVLWAGFLYFVTERILMYAVILYIIHALASPVTWSKSDKMWQQSKIRLPCIECLLRSEHRGTVSQSARVAVWADTRSADCASWEHDGAQACMHVLKDGTAEWQVPALLPL